MLRSAIVLAIAAVIALGGYLAMRWYFRNELLHPTTADATLEAHVVEVRSQLLGVVADVQVQQNQFVSKGQLLFRIDPRPFEARVRQTEAALVVTTADVAADPAEIAALEAAVANAKGRVEAARAERVLAQTLFDDEARLASGGAATARETADRLAKRDGTIALEAAAKAALEQATQSLAAARARIGDPAAEQARIERLRAELDDANVQLEYTTVRAPTDGWVTDFDLRVGQVVNAGETLFYLVEAEPWWIDANVKETRVERIAPGQPVSFTVDMYPGRTFTGRVESVARGSAAAFSLLPPQNTTGNWVKVTQRVPIRIAVDTPPAATPFRKGMSAQVTIDTTVGDSGRRDGTAPARDPAPAGSDRSAATDADAAP